MSTSCSNCGAPRQDDGAVCPYCRAVFPGAVPPPRARHGMPEDVMKAIAAGNKIEAIRLYRLRFKSSLRDAKNAVEAITDPPRR
jgi:ribosomal protein L7/L12